MIQSYHCWVLSQRDHKEKDLYKNIYSCIFCSGKKLENEGMPFNWGMAEQIVYMLVMEYYCAERNNELEEYYVNWKALQELMQSERSRTRRTLYTEADTLWQNQM